MSAEKILRMPAASTDISLLALVISLGSIGSPAFKWRKSCCAMEMET